MRKKIIPVYNVVRNQKFQSLKFYKYIESFKNPWMLVLKH